MNKNPSVSIITITQFSRFDCLQILVDLIQDQNYKNIIEWVIVEGSKTREEIEKSSLQIKDLISKNILKLSIVYIENANYNTPLGKLRNIGNNTCKGDITVCMDDDDYYPKNRVKHAVEQLSSSNALIAGCSRLILYDYNLDKAYQSTGYGKYHSTNACMAWKKAYLKTNSHDETKTFAEEQSFTKSFTEKLIQLEPLSTIVASSHNLNTFNKKKLLVSTYINNNVLKEMSKTVDKLIDEKYLNRYQKIFVNKIVNLYDIVVFCGGFNKQLEPENKNDNNDDYNLIKLAENWVASGKKVAIYGEIGKVTHNGVDYNDWTQFPYEQTFKTLIIRKNYGLICYAPFKIKSEQLWLDVADNNITGYKDNFSKFNCKFDKIIFKSNYQKECFKNTIKIDEVTTCVIPDGVRIEEFKINKDNISRNPYRFCYCANYINGLKGILENIWSVIYNYEPRAELHIYNAFDNFTDENTKNMFNTLLTKPGVMNHGNQPLEMVIREKYMSTFELLITGNTNIIDYANIKECAITGCIPIISNVGIFNEVDGFHLQITNLPVQLIPVNIIQLLKNQNKINELREQYSKSDKNINWVSISKKWFE